MVPHALTIAGSDSGGGAGIQADLKTFSALGAYGASVITALTAQNTREVRAIHDVPPEFIAVQMDAVFEDIRIDVVKIGMLGRPEVIEAVAAGLKRHQVARIVLDPVMVAKSGDRLLREEAVASLRANLVPLATVITPNLPEAGVLLDESAAASEAEMETVSARLLELGPRWVLLKGGHLEGPDSVDVLCDRRQSTRYPARRVATRNTHGTGCTLSSAIAAHLAWGHEMPEAVARAKDYLNAALRTADALEVGGGRGPVNHFHAWWSHAEVAG
ncbi:MAG: bifunctional hydroxymethylpyrimidine kinase/phosphomethylpyrimidine kinase [Gammaproteobacteria bacterium]|nr:bifunctional hydroxymethylpyrimidine kinase/phosphomethylpyrimidine kinase [Gammaproteobacteria bacterium]NIR85519.1 bifunctional hydroxymethylpyrimidine kinase/phosphomethylpyrimidine kinase [Gammaproteobacteria bacterium]NIR89778.1 bifunctional hydroxymethylpyrimidine kinase/phosphomethylpyrimidine kinase [Gammaproteobacteria bacterium]NIU06654.1 bifunctional hydroxymethylpyrimidine kinase/phosphomethylpyrimidine kinase [Gammaproteobacteria bacterium]NIV75045.1 bifunctional hydroxymethylpy